MIYDVRRNGFIRRIMKETSDQDAMALSTDGRILVYIDQFELCLQLVRIPDCDMLVDNLRPRFQIAEQKLNPGAAMENKQVFKDKLYRDLHTYHLYMADAEKAEKQSGITAE